MTNEDKLLTLGICICLFLGAYRVFPLIKDHLPVAQVGQCVDLDYGNYVLNGKILTNDYLRGSSEVEIEVQNPKNITIDVNLTYRDLRELNARNATCKK